MPDIFLSYNREDQAVARRFAEAFVAEYAARVESAYPRRGDGLVLFPFARVFIIAQRGA